MANSSAAVRKSARSSDPNIGGLFPCEAEIARRLSQSPRDWAAKAIILERDGLPKVDAIMGGRFWPAVVAYWNKRYGLSTIETFNPDGEEDLNAL